MKKIKNILVPLDGSRTSLKGLDLAITLAKSLDAEISGLNVIRLSNDFQFPVASEFKQIHKKSSEKIISDAKMIARKEKIPFTGKIVRGDSIGKEILKFTDTKRVDLIIIASKGAHPSSETFIGSVANYIIHKSNIPTTIVK